MIGAKNAYPAPCWNKSEMPEKPGFKEAIINAKTPKSTNIPQRSVGGPHWEKNVFLAFLEAVMDFPFFVIHHPLRNIPSPAGVYNCGLQVFRIAFLMPKKSAIGNISMETMQKNPISRDLAKAQEAIPHRIKGRYHT